MALTKVNRGGLNTGVSDSSNATFLTVDSSEQAVIKSEGGAVTTSVQQGLAKAWIRFNGTGTVAIRDSYNVSSFTDSATGQYYVNLDSAMTDGNYSMVSAPNGNSDSSNTFTSQYSFNGATLASTTAFPVCTKFNGSVYDSSNSSVLVHGDMA